MKIVITPLFSPERQRTSFELLLGNDVALSLVISVVELLFPHILLAQFKKKTFCGREMTNNRSILCNIAIVLIIFNIYL